MSSSPAELDLFCFTKVSQQCLVDFSKQSSMFCDSDPGTRGHPMIQIQKVHKNWNLNPSKVQVFVYTLSWDWFNS